MQAFRAVNSNILSFLFLLAAFSISPWTRLAAVPAIELTRTLSPQRTFLKLFRLRGLNGAQCHSAPLAHFWASAIRLCPDRRETLEHDRPVSLSGRYPGHGKEAFHDRARQHLPSSFLLIRPAPLIALHHLLPACFRHLALDQTVSTRIADCQPILSAPMTCLILSLPTLG